MEQTEREYPYRGIAQKATVLAAISALALFSAVAIAADTRKNPLAGNADAIKAGEKIFDERCMDCHGGDASGGAGPDLTDETWIYGGTDADLFTTVSTGRKGGMPGWSGQLKDDEIWKAIAYIRSLAKKK